MVLLGSTGSIGVNALAIARRFGINVEVLVAGNNATLLQKQIDEFKPSKVVVSSREVLEKIKHANISYGEEAILEAIEESKSEVVVNALVGFLGLKPTLKAIECGKKLALANKESLVVAGAFIDTVNITPIDSEHFGLWYLLNQRKIKKMTITASGGAFRDKSYDFMKSATLEDVLKHPNWSMGQKITIDSATMINKMFELIEAHWLFRDKFQNAPIFDAIIETKSIIHAFVDFFDGSTTAHLAHADMKLPIAFALGFGEKDEILKPIDLCEIGSLEFRKIDTQRYMVWEIKDDILKNPKKGAIVNAANEVAIEKFLKKECGFLDISKKIIDAYSKFECVKLQSIDDVFQADVEVREYIKCIV